MQNDLTIDGFNISTWFAKHMPKPYQAVNMTAAIERLDGYELTEDEKTQIPDLMAGYCRLVDEGGLIGFGDTEFESIADLFSKATKTE